MFRNATRAVARFSVATRAPALRLATLPRATVRTFSITPARRAQPEIVRILDSEIKHEKELDAKEGTSAVPEKVEEMMKEWQVVDNSLDDKVTLTRTHKNETIKLEFLISIAQSESPVEFPEEDGAEETEKNEEEEEYDEPENYPQPIEVTITKDGVSEVLGFKVHLHEGVFMVDGVFLAKNKETLDDLTFDPYTPQFVQLDEALQNSFYQYLEERGLNETLAQAIPEFCDWKEQKEYVQWLEAVKKFTLA